MKKEFNRREFIKTTSLAVAAVGLGQSCDQKPTNMEKPLFKISLAEWSINKSLFNGTTDHLDFAALSRKHDIPAVEYVNQFFMDKAKDESYLGEMKNRADSEGVESLLIMCDNEGALGAVDPKERTQTVEKHKKWAEAAKYLGCHSIRVNGYTGGKFGSEEDNYEESMKRVADGLRQLCEYADPLGLNVIIENHGGHSSDAKWLNGVMKLADHPRAGTLPDFGNFRIHKGEDKTLSYDAYQGVKELMPLAKGVSVKTTVWDDKGNTYPLDYERMMRIVLDAGFRGYCGIEMGWDGSEWETIAKVRDQLLATRASLVKEY